MERPNVGVFCRLCPSNIQAQHFSFQNDTWIPVCESCYRILLKKKRRKAYLKMAKREFTSLHWQNLFKKQAKSPTTEGIKLGRVHDFYKSNKPRRAKNKLR